MEVRPATLDDVDAVVDLAEIVDPPDHGMDVDRDYYATIIGHGRLTVAEASDIVVGYAGAITVAGSQQLSDLFVHPDGHGQGIGRALLDAVWTSTPAEVPRQTFSSIHPSALPLYVRAGMRPLWPLLYLEGTPESLPPSHLTVRDVDADAASALETSWLGWDRSTEWRYWSTRPGGRTLVILDEDEPVAVGCVSRSRARHTLLHLASADRSVTSAAVRTIVASAASTVLVAVPGESRVVSDLIDSGWRLLEHDIYCASEPDLVDPTRLIPHPGLL